MLETWLRLSSLCGYGGGRASCAPAAVEEALFR